MKMSIEMSIIWVLVVVDKNWLVHWTQLESGEMLRQNEVQNIFLKNRWVLERAQNLIKMSISQVWEDLDKNRLVCWTQLG
jgi:hypothetical protein